MEFLKSLKYFAQEPHAPKEETNEQKEKEIEQPVFRAISRIFVDDSQNQNDIMPQARTNILTILFCATIFGMYTIFESNIDTIILGFLSGAAYVHLRERFTLFFQKPKDQSVKTQRNIMVYFKCLFYFILMISLPWIRQVFSDKTIYDDWMQVFHSKINSNTLDDIWGSFSASNNIIKFTQAFLLIKILIQIFGSLLYDIYFYIKRAIHRIISEKKGPYGGQQAIQDLLHKLFVVVFILAFLIFILIIAGIGFECSEMIKSAGNTIEKYNNCSLFDDNSSMPHCSQVMTGNLYQYLPQINNKHQLGGCIKHLQNFENGYLKFNLIKDKKQVCLFYQILKEYSPKLVEQLLTIQSTKIYLSTLFSQIFNLLIMTSNGVFSLTTFISIFLLSVKNFRFTQKQFNIFGQTQNPLIVESTNLILNYILVAVKHLTMSLVIFEVFHFSDISIILSILISSVTLFPLISVTVIMFIFASVKYFITQPGDYLSYLSAGLCFAIFKISSNSIFDDHFNNMDFSKALISLSAVFGLYRFGVAGTFYGPLLILLFRCSYFALLKKKK